MTIQLGQVAPDFEQDTTRGRIGFHAWLGSSWGVLFSHPQGVTPACTTELGAVAKLGPEWRRRDVKVIGLSVDPVDSHRRREGDVAEAHGAELDVPVIADPDGSVSRLYGLVHPEADPAVAVRAVYVIDPSKRVRLSLAYPPSAGRDFDEVLRVIDSLQLADAHEVTVPASWTSGDDLVIAPSLGDEAARGLFSESRDAPKPRLRTTRQPATS